MDRVTEREVLRTAQVTIENYGTQAKLRAQFLLERYTALADACGIDAWTRILAKIEELEKPPPYQLTKSGHVKWWK